MGAGAASARECGSRGRRSLPARAPLSVSSATTYATGAAYDSVIVSGTFMDAGPFDIALTATIDWGDGSAPTLVTLPAGSYAFSVPHDYTSDSVSQYAIGVTLDDGTARPPSRRRPSPSATRPRCSPRPGLVLSSSSIDEGDTVTVSGTIVSPGGIDTNTVSIDWGDGSPPTTIVLPPGVYTFSTPPYLSEQPGRGCLRAITRSTPR